MKRLGDDTEGDDFVLKRLCFFKLLRLARPFPLALKLPHDFLRFSLENSYDISNISSVFHLEYFRIVNRRTRAKAQMVIKTNALWVIEHRLEGKYSPHYF